MYRILSMHKKDVAAVFSITKLVPPLFFHNSLHKDQHQLQAPAQGVLWQCDIIHAEKAAEAGGAAAQKDKDTESQEHKEGQNPDSVVCLNLSWMCAGIMRVWAGGVLWHPNWWGLCWAQIYCWFLLNKCIILFVFATVDCSFLIFTASLHPAPFNSDLQ